MGSKQKKVSKTNKPERFTGFVPSIETTKLYLKARIEQTTLQIKSILRKAWYKDTSSDQNNWSKKNPAWGQCAVSALFVNDMLGGKLIWAEALLPDGRKISHYFNLVNGIEIDLTKEQFPKGTVIPKGIDKKKEFPTTRDYVLSYESTRIRYGNLKERIDSISS